MLCPGRIFPVPPSGATALSAARHGGPGPSRAGGVARRPGFTLIEVMISLILLSVVFTLLYGSFFQVSSGTELLQEQLTQQQELRLLLKMLTDDLQAARFFGGFARDTKAPSGLVAEEEFIGSGKFSNVRFHAEMQARFYPQVEAERDPNMHEVAYRVQPSEEDRDRLVLVRREDFYLDDDMDEGGVTIVLVEDIHAFLVEFLPLARRTRETEDDWQGEWETADRPREDPMPMAVRVTVGFLDRRGKPIVETLVVNLPATLKVGP